MERDLNVVSYISVTKQGNKTWKYLWACVFTAQKGLGTSVQVLRKTDQAWLSHRDSLVTLAWPWTWPVVLHAQGHDPSLKDHSVPVTGSMAAIVPDDVNSSSAGC